MKIDETTGRRVIRVLGPGGWEIDIDDPRDRDRPTRHDEVMLEQIEKRQVEIVDEYLDEDDVVTPAVTTPPAAGNPGLPPGDVDEPHRGASRDAWVEFAISKGADPADIEDLKRDELVDRFGTPAS